jgi:cytidylate kinase
VGERARRRLYDEKSGESFSSLQDVKEKLIRRDAYDSSREISPLQKADDAVFIDSTHLTVDEVCRAIISRVDEGQ